MSETATYPNEFESLRGCVLSRFRALKLFLYINLSSPTKFDERAQIGEERG